MVTARKPLSGDIYLHGCLTAAKTDDTIVEV
jgi:hypothetical protein